MKKIAIALRLIGAGGMVALIAQAGASGYNFGVQSASGQGVANAGGAAAADAATIFYNPAGMVNLPGDNLSAAMIVVAPNIKVSNLHAQTATSRTISGGGVGPSPTSTTLVPQFYATHQFSDQLFGGVGVFVPFGDKTAYDPHWNGRYAGVKIDMKTVAINPQLAYKFNDAFSVGVGLTAQYMTANFNKQADFGSAAYSFGAKIPAFVAGDGKFDGSLAYEGHDWGFGWNIGAMWQVDSTLRFGAAYRSSISHTLTGDVDWSVPNFSVTKVNSDLTKLGYVNSKDAKVKLKTPDSFSLNFYKEVNPQLAVMGDWTHTRHSKFQQLALEFSNQLSDAVIKQKWKNTNRYALGATYRLSDPWLLRFGVAYDQSPIPSDDLRIPNLPDSDRTWYSFGANYAFSKNVSVDLAYTYVNLKDSKMNYKECSSSAGCTGSGSLTKADFKSYVNLFGLQLNYRF